MLNNYIQHVKQEEKIDKEKEKIKTKGNENK